MNMFQQVSSDFHQLSLTGLMFGGGIQVKHPEGVETLYIEAKCIMGNGHMGTPPCGKNDGQTWMKTLLSGIRYHLQDEVPGLMTGGGTRARTPDLIWEEGGIRVGGGGMCSEVQCNMVNGYMGPPPHPGRMSDRHDWKHYLPTISLADGNNAFLVISCVMFPIQ